jgi:hypothetical protein
VQENARTVEGCATLDFFGNRSCNRSVSDWFLLFGNSLELAAESLRHFRSVLLYTAFGKLYKSTIMHGDRLILGLIALVLFGCWAGFRVFSRGARLSRRRRKNHSRVIAKSNRPMVRFSVRSPKK